VDGLWKLQRLEIVVGDVPIFGAYGRLQVLITGGYGGCGSNLFFGVNFRFGG